MNMQFLSGANFSGRTEHLRRWAGMPEDPTADCTYSGCAYIGLDTANSFSGLAETLAAEIELLSQDSRAQRDAREALEFLGFSYCLDRNPFTLSGGEQVVAAVISAMAARPERLAIDCAFEQLSAQTRTGLIACLERHDGDLMVADNRLDEWFDGPTLHLESKHAAVVTAAPLACVPPVTGCQIEVSGLSHAYMKNRSVFENFSATFEAGRHYFLSGPNGSGKVHTPRKLIPRSFSQPFLTLFTMLLTARSGVSPYSRLSRMPCLLPV